MQIHKELQSFSDIAIIAIFVIVSTIDNSVSSVLNEIHLVRKVMISKVVLTRSKRQPFVILKNMKNHIQKKSYRMFHRRNYHRHHHHHQMACKYRLQRRIHNSLSSVRSTYLIGLKYAQTNQANMRTSSSQVLDRCLLLCKH